MGWFDERTYPSVVAFWDCIEAVIRGHHAAAGADGFPGDGDYSTQIPHLLAEARQGSWEPLERYLAGIGRRGPAQVLQDWRRTMGIVYSTALPELVAAKQGDELVGVLLAVRDYIARSLEIIVGAYQRQAEDRARAALHNYADVLDASPDPVISIDARGCVTAINRAAQSLFGYTRTQALGNSIADLIIPERFRQLHHEGVERARRSGRSQVAGKRLAMTAIRADGTEFPVELSIVATPTSTGEQAFTGFIRDLTAQQQQDETNAFWAHAFEQAGFGIVVSEPSTRAITRVNTAYARMLGFQPDELVGIIGDRLIASPETLDRAPITSSLAKHGHHTYELELLHRDGTIIPVIVSSSVFTTRSGPLLVSTVIDSSERARLERERETLVTTLESRVRERTAELEAVNRDLESFGYSVSHDLRAPLRAIDGFSRILQADHAGPLDEDGQHLLERIRVATRRMGTLIDDLLRFSRIARTSLVIRKVNISALAAEVIEELRSRDLQRHVRVTIQAGLVARADTGLARIVLDNLLGNAWKFSAPSQDPCIELGASDGRYFVRDNGAGFDMTYVGKLFQPFQRLHTVSEFEGTGIGLATVQRIIQHHGGTISIESALGLGTTVWFTFGASA